MENQPIKPNDKIVRGITQLQKQVKEGEEYEYEADTTVKGK